MATNRPQGDLVGWEMEMKHFRIGKTIEMSFLEETPYATYAGCGI